MKKIVEIPEGVNVTVDGFKVTVKGKETIERDFYDQTFATRVKIQTENDKLTVSSESDKRKVKAFVGTLAAHIGNMVKGCVDGYTYKLKVCYVHFPMTVKVEGSRVSIANFLGEKKPRFAKILDGAKVVVKKDDVIVTSNDKELAGQTAANIEVATKITSRDRRVYQDGVFITEKAK